jgi:hypothetical protein
VGWHRAALPCEFFLLLGWHSAAFVLHVAHFFAEKYSATIQDNRPRLPMHNKQQYNIHGNKQSHHVPDLPFVGLAH